MLAAALSHDAKLLILDEPTSGLDPVARDDILEVLAEYIADGSRSVLFSTHITADLERIADYVTLIDEGRIVYTGAKDDLVDAYRVIHGAPGHLTPRPASGPSVCARPSSASPPCSARPTSPRSRRPSPASRPASTRSSFTSPLKRRRGRAVARHSA
jgi:ABC-type glutathione transport system ATPase component